MILTTGLAQCEGIIMTRTTRTPAFWDTPCHPMITHTSSDSHQIQCHKKTKSKLQIPKIQIFEFCNNSYTRHTFWSCLIRCANMKWIWPVLWKIQGGHGFVHRRTDRRTDDVKPVYPPFNFVEAGGIIKMQTSIDTGYFCQNNPESKKQSKKLKMSKKENKSFILLSAIRNILRYATIGPVILVVITGATKQVHVPTHQPW